MDRSCAEALKQLRNKLEETKKLNLSLNRLIDDVTVQFVITSGVYPKKPRKRARKKA
jgi:hypothetical protein